MTDILDLVDVQELRNEVQKKYRDVAEKPAGNYHFHTGRQHAIRLGYDQATLDQLADEACEAFAGMANPFHWETPGPGGRMMIADMCIEKPIPESALRDIDLWTG